MGTGRPVDWIRQTLGGTTTDSPSTRLLTGNRKSTKRLLDDLQGERRRNYRYVLLRTSKDDVEAAPFVDLAESIIRRQELGEVVDLRGWNTGGHGSANDFLEQLHDAGSSEDGAALADSKADAIAFHELAGLEGSAQPAYDCRFSRLAGGLRPVVIVLDDYNDYVKRKDRKSERSEVERNGRRFEPIDDRIDAAAERYGVSPERFREALRCHCDTLNELGETFLVRAPPLWLTCADDGAPDYERIAASLPFHHIDGRRNQICAFLVDLEWLPFCSQDGDSRVRWPSNGLRILRLLSLCYPEIPSFLYTGLWSQGRLLRGLTNGAVWCFQKNESHHTHESGDKANSLTRLTLEEKLTTAAEIRYGAYSDPPYPRQLCIDDGVQRQFRAQFGDDFSIYHGATGNGLRRLVARLFPDTPVVSVPRLCTTGRSRSTRGVFIAELGGGGGPTGKRIVKVALWSAIVKEWNAYKRVIEPQLNSQVAYPIGGPVMIRGEQPQDLTGAIAYSLAGFPETSDLCSLAELLESRDVTEVEKRVTQTCKQVLSVLYESRRSVLRPLWMWFGDVLPPFCSGVLVPVHDPTEEVPDDRIWRVAVPRDRDDYGSADRLADAVRTAALLGFHSKTDDVSPWRYPRDRVVLLDGFELAELDPHGDGDFGYVTFRHPALGFRIRLRGDPADIGRRWGAAWGKPGMLVRVRAVLDARGRDWVRIQTIVDEAIAAEGQKTRKHLFARLGDEWAIQTAATPRQTGVRPATDFFDLFHRWTQSVADLNFGLTALEGRTHGDLNLENLMFSGTGPAWLIDFERAAETGMIALDLAHLEVSIWNREVPSLLAQDSPRPWRALGELLARLETTDRDGDMREDQISRHSSRLNKLAQLFGQLRDFGAKLGVTPNEARWARAACAFQSLKFSSTTRERLWTYAMSVWHLAGVAPSGESLCERPERFIEAIPSGRVSDADRRRLNAFVLAADKSYCVPGVVRAAAGESIRWNRDGERVPAERWDVTSTGSAGDLTALIGHLWLLVRAGAEPEDAGDVGAPKIVAPKISARGTSGGGIDVLDSGGYVFANHVDQLVSECRRQGSAVAREGLVPVDTVLLETRRVAGAMKNGVLTYLSVMSKAVRAGCTHVVVDVKCGFDTKMRLDTSAGSARGLVSAELPDALSSEEMLDELKSFLDRIGVEASRDEDVQWLTQNVRGVEPLAPLKEVRWCVTNADRPQGRAIGRVLTLLHLDGLIRGAYRGHSSHRETLLRRDEGWAKSEYGCFYGNGLAALCGVDQDHRNPAALECGWVKLRTRMTRRLAEHGILLRVPAWMSRIEAGTERAESLEQWNNDLSVYSAAAFPYCTNSRDTVRVAGHDMKRWDRLFRWLCGPDPMDGDVGLWLHALPDEELEPGMPLISVFFRPSRTPDRTVAERVRYLLHGGVVSVRD